MPPGMVGTSNDVALAILVIAAVVGIIYVLRKTLKH
jgi:hypothetical protein